MGEAPTDTSAIQNLLRKRYPAPAYDFVTLLDQIHGSLLDSQKIKRFLRIEFEDKRPDIVIFIRDLDSIHTHSQVFSEKKRYFSESNRVVNKQGIFLLNIYEIEALVVADIEAFNRKYQTALEYNGDCMMLEDPKGFLRSHCKSYSEIDNAELFKELSFDTLLEKCRYFQGFIYRFNKRLAV
ncbi:hypothetical protein GCM10023229_14260 [Flavisolibacter ginsenosidimutans]